jgi:hypothetical protein
MFPNPINESFMVSPSVPSVPSVLSVPYYLYLLFSAVRQHPPQAPGPGSHLPMSLSAGIGRRSLRAG